MVNYVNVFGKKVLIQKVDLLGKAMQPPIIFTSEFQLSKIILKVNGCNLVDRKTHKMKARRSTSFSARQHVKVGPHSTMPLAFTMKSKSTWHGEGVYRERIGGESLL